MKRHFWIVVTALCVMAVIVVGLWYYLQPRTITTIEWPSKISAFGLVGGLAPGNDLTLYVKVKNPSLTFETIGLRYIQPDKPYELKYDPFGTINDKIVPPVEYQPAPPEAKDWFNIETSDKTTWGVVDLWPFQEKALPFRINIPKEVELPKNWYFYIEARDGNESGFIVTRAESTILVNMR